MVSFRRSRVNFNGNFQLWQRSQVKIKFDFLLRLRLYVTVDKRSCLLQRNIMWYFVLITWIVTTLIHPCPRHCLYFVRNHVRFAWSNCIRNWQCQLLITCNHIIFYSSFTTWHALRVGIIKQNGNTRSDNKHRWLNIAPTSLVRSLHGATEWAKRSRLVCMFIYSNRHQLSRTRFDIRLINLRRRITVRVCCIIWNFKYKTTVTLTIALQNRVSWQNMSTISKIPIPSGGEFYFYNGYAKFKTRLNLASVWVVIHYFVQT